MNPLLREYDQNLVYFCTHGAYWNPYRLKYYIPVKKK